MNGLAFSVVIPTHNRAGLVERALRSVISQDAEDYEVIVVDDGSTDVTPQVLSRLRSPRCHVIRSEVSRGVSASRNCGAAAATGRFITFLDDDDELRPGAMAALKKYQDDYPQFSFFWGGRLVRQRDASGNLVETREDLWQYIPGEACDRDFLDLTLEIATNCAFTIRRSVFVEIGGFDEQLLVSEDRDLFISLAHRGYLGAAVPKVLIEVDAHFKNSLSRGVGIHLGPDTDLRIIEKHRKYLDLPQCRGFVDEYLLAIFAGYLQAGNRRGAMRMLGKLRQRSALDSRILRKYVRHAPEFRALKTFLGYDQLRRLRNRLSVSRRP